MNDYGHRLNLRLEYRYSPQRKVRTMTKIKLVSSLYLLSAIFFGLALIPQATKAQDVDLENSEIFALRSGAADFKYYCASCHGIKGKGDGPIAAALLTKPADLTRISARNNGKFPTERVMNIIDGRNQVMAHGPRDMPVWGYEFDWDPQNIPVTPDAKERIHFLTDYLKTLQK